MHSIYVNNMCEDTQPITKPHGIEQLKRNCTKQVIVGLPQRLSRSDYEFKVKLWRKKIWTPNIFQYLTGIYKTL